MKVKFIQLYKTDDTWLKTGIAQYSDRLSRYLSFESKEVEVPAARGKSRDMVLQLEAQKILSGLKASDYLVLLDEQGQTFSSVQFSSWLNKKFTGISGDLIFLVGGAYGFHESLRERAKESISLSSMTFTHQMVRLIFVEQLYRAMTILKNEPYHHS